MGNTNARNQQTFRERVKREGGARVELTLPKEVLDVVTTTVQYMGVSRQDAVIHLINQGASTMQRNLYREDQSGGQPSRPSQMTAAEAIELANFKEQLPTGIINAELNARQVQANGGAAGVAQKERITAMLQANNQHFKK